MLLRISRLILLLTIILSGATQVHAQHGSQTDTVLFLKQKAEELKDSARIDVLNQIVFFSTLSTPVEAEKIALQAIDEAELIGYEKGKAKALQRLGIINYRRGHTAESIKCLKDAERILLILGDSLDLSELYRSLGNAFSGFDDEPVMSDYYRKALNYCDSAKYPRVYASALHNISGTFLRNHDLDTAEDYLHRAYTIYSDYDYSFGIARAMNSFGAIAVQKRSFKEALSYFRQALSYYEKALDKTSIGTTCNSIARVYFKQHDLDSAMIFAEKGLKFSIEVDAKVAVRDCLEVLYRIYNAKAEFKTALEYFERYEKIKSELIEFEHIQDLDYVEIVKAQNQAELENIILKRENEINERKIYTQRILLISGVILMILFVTIIIGLAYWVLRSKRTNKIVAEQFIELEKQKRLLEESHMINKSMLDLLGHDLKNPTGSIIGLSEILLDEDPRNKYLRSINKSGEKLLQVINQASTLGELRQGGKLKKETINLKRMIKDCFDDYSNSIENAGMNFKIYINKDLHVHASPMICSIFANFIQNAIKYANDGKLIEAGAEKDNGKLKVFIADKGQTIPEDKRQIIFDRRIQLEDNHPKGSGLGLAISQRIAEAHYAEIGVEPNEPNGNVFYVIFKV